ncbi:ImmA/IrrE family metallo-endopeptidase [Hymenobacter sp.]|uniref:ImmA/IrrE family metallo-endopeptidase n=1 Tax=Hymenobacter sp. TaxID=1898978 RepID=UPI00286AD2BC|nr:ImmA/IrrE family metallo-endopeptidase [Hymenobacter sp.]
MDDKYKEVDALLGGLFPSQTLRELFDYKVQALGVSPTTAARILGVQLRALNGILNGTQKVIDITIISKLASFVQLPREKIVNLYLDGVEKHFPTSTISATKVEFIKSYFDLAALRKAGWIENITDFAHIEKRLTARLGLKSILEYRKPAVDVAFCVGTYEPKNELTRAVWIKAAQACFTEIDNLYPYDRAELVKLFPRLRWFTTNEEHGLAEVIKLLHRVGVTVVLQPSMPGLQLRGATFNHDGKPCVVVTDFVGFYPTLWFALFHELFHVLFDWDDIKLNQYHITDDENKQLSVQEREREANNFAGEYLFSREKVAQIKYHLHDDEYVTRFAADNQVHPSIIYTQCAFAMPKNRSAWILARKHSPSAGHTISQYGFALENGELIAELTKPLKSLLYA